MKTLFIRAALLLLLPAAVTGCSTAAPVSTVEPVPYSPPGETVLSSPPVDNPTLADAPSVQSGPETPGAATDIAEPPAAVGSAPPSIITASLPGAGIGSLYSQALAASGGNTPYTWALSGGSLPPGFSIDPLTGMISGTPVDAGTSSFTASITDNAGVSADKSFSITIAPFVSIGSLPDGDIGVPYSHFLVVSGSKIPDTWEVTGGSLPSGLSLDSATGEITGIPLQAGASGFTVGIGGVTKEPLSVTFSVKINPLPAITTDSLPDAGTGSFYLESLDVSGGTPPYTWSLAGGSLPPGLSLEAAGLVADYPTAAGSYDFTVLVADGAGATAEKELSIMVNPGPSISTTVLAAGYIGAPYSQSLAASGGTRPYRWSLAGGSLPAGLLMGATTGVISGVPSVSGTFSFTVRSTDHDGYTATRPLSITVNEVVAAIPLPPGDVGVYYSQDLAQSSSTPYTWMLGSGSLPDGLFLDGSGSISGTPTAAGTFVFIARVTGIAEQAISLTLTLTINPAPRILTASFPEGEVGVSYSQVLEASGGTPPLVWAVDGQLPFGLSLDGTTGVVAGTPTTAGAYSFGIEMSDSAGGTASRVFSMKVGLSGSAG